MKKLIFLLLAVMLLAACGQAEEKNQGAMDRSITAAEALVELGYTNIKEFGGIIDWPYEVEQWKSGWQTAKTSRKS